MQNKFKIKQNNAKQKQIKNEIKNGKKQANKTNGKQNKIKNHLPVEM